MGAAAVRLCPFRLEGITEWGHCVADLWAAGSLRAITCMAGTRQKRQRLSQSAMPTKMRADSFVREFGVRRGYTNAADMFQNESLDFVDIVTQPASHRDLVKLAAAHKVPVICQKPLALALDDAEAMARTCSEAGMPFMVHENFRWQGPMRALKFKSDRIGPLFFGRICFRCNHDVYRDQPYLATDPRFILIDLGVHLLDLARFFFGEVVQLTCNTQRVNPGIKGEDVATVLLTMQSGATCIVDMSYASKLEEDLFPQTLVHLEGRDGSATLGSHFRLTTATPQGVEHKDVSPRLYAWSRPPGHATQEGVAAIQKHWCDCLRAGTATETCGEDNLKTLELVFGAYRSAEENQPYSVRSAQ